MYEFEKKLFYFKDGKHLQHESPCSVLDEVLNDINTYRKIEAPCPVCGGDMGLTNDGGSHYFECMKGCCVSTDSGDTLMEAVQKLLDMKCYQDEWDSNSIDIKIKVKQIKPEETHDR